MRIGILSFAHLHAESYLPLLQTFPDVDVIGLADDDAVRGAAAARQFGVPYFPSYAALFAVRPDAVIVCSENRKHRALVEQAAAAGVHVLCEKPLATTLADAQAMLDACARAGVQLMTAFPLRFSPPVMEVKAQLAAGALGPVYACNATNQGQLPRRHRAWFVDPDLAGGGAVMDHTVHLADILRWYLGSEVVEVYAQTNRILHADVPVETGGLLLLTFANGVFASIDCSWSKPDSYPTWGGLGFELITGRGAVFVDAYKQHLTVYPATGPATWPYWGSDPDRAMLAAFLAAVRTATPPPVTGQDGYQALAVALAAYESARTGQPVRLGAAGPTESRPEDTALDNAPVA
jgi:predicted dehydrogenase